MKWLKWLLVGVVIGGALTWSLSDAHANTPFDINAKSAIVIKADTNEVVFGKNVETVRPIASITKMMTAIVAVEADLPLDEEIVITQEDVRATMLRGRPYSTSLPVGTTITRQSLLQLALMNSQNRAAAALARTYPGGTSAFVKAMNAKAVALGMTHTHFVEPTGLMSTNVSTAEDLAVMVKHASTIPLIQELSTARELKTPIQYKNTEHLARFGTTNRLLKRDDWNIEVQKTGYINAAGRCLVMMTQVADMPFVMVLLNTQSSYARAGDAIRIKTWLETGTVASSATIAAMNPYKAHAKKPKAKQNKKHKKKRRR